MKRAPFTTRRERAARRYQRARALAEGGCVRDYRPATGREIQIAADLITFVAENVHTFEVGPDQVLYAAMPDAEDLELMRAGRALAVEEGRLSPSQIDEGLNVPEGELPVFFQTVPREPLLAKLREAGGWSEEHLAMLSVRPPANVVLIAYDGTACGHGVSACVRRAPSPLN